MIVSLIVVGGIVILVIVGRVDRRPVAETVMTLIVWLLVALAAVCVSEAVANIEAAAPWASHVEPG